VGPSAGSVVGARVSAAAAIIFKALSLQGQVSEFAGSPEVRKAGVPGVGVRIESVPIFPVSLPEVVRSNHTNRIIIIVQHNVTRHFFFMLDTWNAMRIMGKLALGADNYAVRSCRVIAKNSLTKIRNKRILSDSPTESSDFW